MTEKNLLTSVLCTAVTLLMTTVVMLVIGAFVWGFMGAPMMRNYAECGTIFLCENQK